MRRKTTNDFGGELNFTFIESIEEAVNLSRGAESGCGDALASGYRPWT